MLRGPKPSARRSARVTTPCCARTSCHAARSRVPEFEPTMVWSRSGTLRSHPLRDRSGPGDAATSALRGRGLDAGGGLQGLGAVGALPGELGFLAAEVAVGRGLLEYRAV